MLKRTVTLRSRRQRFQNPRLACFKLRIEMNPEFDSNDLKRFINYFDKLLSEDLEDDLSVHFSRLMIDTNTNGNSSHRDGNFSRIHREARINCKYINLEHIKQNPKAYLPLEFFINVFKNHEPDLLTEAFEKIGIQERIYFAPTRDFSYSRYRSHLSLIHLKKRLESGQTNPLFKKMIYHLHIESTFYDFKRIFESCESTIISMCVCKVNGSGKVSSNVNEDLAEQLKSNSNICSSLQFLHMKTQINEEFLFKFLLEPSENNLSFLKEFMFYAPDGQTFASLMDILSEENALQIRANFVRLTRLGFYTKPTSSNVFTKEYVPEDEDYIHVTCSKHFYVHYFEGDQAASYKVYLTDEADIY